MIERNLMFNIILILILIGDICGGIYILIIDIPFGFDWLKIFLLVAILFQATPTAALLQARYQIDELKNQLEMMNSNSITRGNETITNSQINARAEVDDKITKKNKAIHLNLTQEYLKIDRSKYGEQEFKQIIALYQKESDKILSFVSDNTADTDNFINEFLHQVAAIKKIK